MAARTPTAQHAARAALHAPTTTHHPPRPSTDRACSSRALRARNTQARKYLGWEPKIPLESGIVKAADYFRSLDLARFRKPTKHTAHANTEQIEQAAKKQKTS